MIGQLRRSLTLVVVVAAIAACLTFSTPVNAASGLADAYRIIAGKQFIDLTHSFGPDSPVWSGFGQAKMTPAIDPRPRLRIRLPRTVSTQPTMRWSANTEPMSTRRRIFPRPASPWTRSR